VQGTGAGQWSARKAQLMAKRYKAAGGGYKWVVWQNLNVL
jgi:hypothetical protein